MLSLNQYDVAMCVHCPVVKYVIKVDIYRTTYTFIHVSSKIGTKPSIIYLFRTCQHDKKKKLLIALLKFFLLDFS